MRPNSAPDLLSFTVRSIPRSSHLASKLNLRLQNRCSQTSGWHHGSIISSVSELNQQLKHHQNLPWNATILFTFFQALLFFFVPLNTKLNHAVIASVTVTVYSLSDRPWHQESPSWWVFAVHHRENFHQIWKKMQQMCLDLSRPNEVTQLDKRFKTLPCIW